MSYMHNAADIIKFAVEPATLFSVVEGVLKLTVATLAEVIYLTVVQVCHYITVAFGHLFLIDTVVLVGVPRASIVGLIEDGYGLIVSPFVKVDLLCGDIRFTVGTIAFHIG